MSIFKNIGKNTFRLWALNRKPIEELHYEVEVTDKDGKRVYFKRAKAHSYILPYLQVLQQIYSMTNGSTAGLTASMTDTSGVAHNITMSNSITACQTFPTNAPAALSTYGNVIGTSNAANILNQNALIGQILHGITTGTMAYGAQTYEAISNTSGLTWAWRHIRTFTNSTIATQYIQEIGTYFFMYYSGNSWYFCMCRDVVSPQVAVNAGQTLTVRYIRSITIV